MTATADARLAQNLDGMFFEGDVLIRAKDTSGNWGKRIGRFRRSSWRLIPVARPRPAANCGCAGNGARSPTRLHQKRRSQAARLRRTMPEVN